MSSAGLARAHLVGFLRALREAGIAAPVPKPADFLLSIAASPPEDVDGLYWRARVTLVTAAEDFSAFDTVFDAFFRGGPLLLEESFGASPEAEGETAAPKGGDDGELAAPEVHEGSGLHASPLESVGTRRFAPDLGRRARGPAGDRCGDGDRAAGHDRKARRACAPRPLSRPPARAPRSRTAQAARCCASRGATVRRAPAAC